MTHRPTLLARTRAAIAAFTRNYDAAGGSGRWPAGAMMASQAAAALAARPVLARKAAWLVANAPIGASIANVWCTHLIGDGPSIRSGHPNRAMRHAIEAAWNLFFVRADVEGGDLVSLLNRVVRALVGDGEAFLRLLTTARGELRLQLLPASQIDASVNTELPDGGSIVHGIERGPNGEPRAYYVLPRAPDQPFVLVGPAMRIDASEICHVFEPRFAGQVRGVSWLHAVMTRVLDFDALADAGVMKAKVSALFCGFIRDMEGATEDDDMKLGELSLEPGTLRRLRNGQDITFSPVADMTGLNDFVKAIAREICAGCGVPYELVTGDLTGVNFSSARVGLHNFQRRCTAIRASVLGARLLVPVFERVVTLEVLSGRLNAPKFARDAESFFAFTPMWPSWPQINPIDDTTADALAVANGFRSRAEVVSARGRDVADVDAEIAADTFEPAAPITLPKETKNVAA